MLHIKEQLMKIESLLSSGANSTLQDEVIIVVVVVCAGMQEGIRDK